MLDSLPATKLRLTPEDVERRAGLERRKLREMIEFCYTEYCYRGHILDYFGDRHHTRQCGACGNCTTDSSNRTPLSAAEALSDASGLDRNLNSRIEAKPLRALTDDENLRVRKILAGAARMKGRFGKSTLAATLRGSAAKNVMQAHLNKLTTYGLLKDMRQDDILHYIDALCAARCLRVSRGEYPTVSTTELGERVMRDEEHIDLALGEGAQVKDEDDGIVPATALKTYTLFCNGRSVEEIATDRKLVTSTIEGHLLECLAAGLTVNTSQFVSDSERTQIEAAIAEHGTDKLKPIRESLPENITYNMIRFVVAEKRIAKAASDLG